MVETLTENQKSLVENIERKCGEMVEQRCKELMVIFQASQNQNSTQQTSLEQKVEKVRKSVTARKEGTVVVKQHGPSKTTTAREEETVAVKQDKEPPSKTTTEKNDQASQSGDVKKKGKKKNEEQLKLHLEATVSRKLKMEKQEVPKMDKVKLEKAEANTVASNKGKQIIEIKAGMEVSLQSPNSMCLAAVGTVQNADANSLGSDGKPLRDYVEVLVNYVCSKTTMLPRAHGRLKKLENAQAKCIPWPRMFINETTKAEFNHVDIYKGHDLLRQRPELYAQIPPECGLKKKRKRTSSAAMNADDRKTNSQTVDKNQNKERMELEEPEQIKDGAKM